MRGWPPSHESGRWQGAIGDRKSTFGSSSRNRVDYNRFFFAKYSRERLNGMDPRMDPKIAPAPGWMRCFRRGCLPRGSPLRGAIAALEIAGLPHGSEECETRGACGGRALPAAG